MGEGWLCPAVGSKVLQLRGRPGLVLTAEGCWWASPAVDCLGPGQSSVLPHHGDSDVVGLPRLLQTSWEGSSSHTEDQEPDTLALVVNLNMDKMMLGDHRHSTGKVHIRAWNKTHISIW